MKTRPILPFVAMLFVALTLVIQPSAQADTFGSGANTFTIDFVSIGNAGNAGDTRTNSASVGRGVVPYEYRIGKYEISQNVIDSAIASGMANVTAGAWSGSQPAADISWYEAAAFVNWLNTSTGKTAAYNLAWDGSAWSMNLWSSGQAWQLGGENLYRNKDAYYFLPSEDEWYKAAYYNPAGTNYFLYPTASSSLPTAVASGTNAGTAVYNQDPFGPPTGVDVAGGLSPYGTMGQGGNLWEWNETAYDRANDSSSEIRTVRGGVWSDSGLYLRSSTRDLNFPEYENEIIGFRVASASQAPGPTPIPEPGTWAAAALLAGAAGYVRWRRRRAA